MPLTDMTAEYIYPFEDSLAVSVPNYYYYATVLQPFVWDYPGESVPGG